MYYRWKVHAASEFGEGSGLVRSGSEGARRERKREERREGSARAARGMLRLDVATQAVMGTRGSNGTAEGIVTGVTSDL